MSKPNLDVAVASVSLTSEPVVRSTVHLNNCNNLLTQQEVQVIVNHATVNNPKIERFSIKNYSDGKLGFLGSHKRLCVDVKTRNGRDKLSFFLKVVPFDVPSQAEYVLDKQVFLKERIFCRDIAPKLYDAYNCEAWTPCCYLVKENLLVFEDLALKGYFLRSKLLYKELIVAGLTTIARLHASSLLAEARLGKSLKEMYPEAFLENSFCESGKTRCWFDVSVKAIVAVAEYLGLDASLVPKACEEIFPAIQASSTKKNVVSHGDLWSNNLMFSDTLPPKCLLVDFQLMRYSPLAHDVAQFLYLCADNDFRVTWEEIMLKHYYSVLCEIINSSKSIPIEVPAWSELISGMEEQKLAAVITAAIFFQTVLLDEKLGDELLSDPESYHEFEFINRSEVVLKIMEHDSEYRRRLTQVVTELVELSFRLDQLPKPT